MSTLTDELAQLRAATHALATASSLDEVKRIRDMALAARAYSRAAKLGLEAQNYASEIKILAEYKAGEMLAQLKRDTPQTANPSGLPKSNDGHGSSEYQAALEETGTSRQDANRWQKIAEVPEEVLKEHIKETIDAKKELTTSSVIQLAARIKQPEPVETPELPTGRYRCIVIDPPWPIKKIEREQRPNQGASLDYPTMTLDEISGLPISDLAEEAAHLYLWVTQKFLPDGLVFVEKWGFVYQCLLTWDKPTGITPFSWMYNTEHVIYAHRGGLKLDTLGLKLSFSAPSLGHSQKPDIFYDRVVLASPGPRLDMFARREREHVQSWGNEV